MNRIIKTVFYIFLGTFIFSCAQFKPDLKNKASVFKLIKTEKLVNYKLLSYANDFDTILVVAKNQVTEKCITENLIYLSLQGFNKIDKLSDNGEEISFIYHIKGGENNHLKVLTSSQPPGISKGQIFSYNSYPFFIEKCVELKK